MNRIGHVPANKKFVATKPSDHPCSLCQKPIEVGQECTSYAGISKFGVGWNPAHVQCVDELVDKMNRGEA